jgi:NAD(P)-dependent dehydrogenase (short-subunit alcohol dehydrogenase family)
MSRPLSGQVALVAGATRGAGRGIARELAAAGAKVYCSGRSTRGHAATPGRPETIEETAELIVADGGSAVAVRTDHCDEAEVAALAARLKRDEGRLDILVNDIWGGDELIGWDQKFWQIDMGVARRLLDQAMFTHLITARHMAPLMIENTRGLIVEVTDGEFPGYRGQLLYDLIKASLIRLAYAMAWDLKGTGVTALAISPGFLRSEAMLERFGVREANWRDGVARDAQFIFSETPRYVGRAIAALAADPNVGARSGSSIWAADLAAVYGFTDLDGSQPNFWRNVENWLDGEIAKGAPLSDDARWIASARYAHIHNDPARAEQAKRYAAALPR